MDYEQFKSQVYALTKIDLSSYKEKQMKRRIDSLITKNNYKGYSDYKPGTNFIYSNLGCGILACVCEKITNKYFDFSIETINTPADIPALGRRRG